MLKQFFNQDLIERVKEIMIEVATGKQNIDSVNGEYRDAYAELARQYAENDMQNPNPYSDLWEFYEYWRKHLPRYADRRAFVIRIYKPETPVESPFWIYIHPQIRAISQPRFKSGHLANAIEAALKEVNSRVKAFVRHHNGTDLDGSSLMKHAFSVNHPVIKLGDITTETGRSIQQGYMELFAGAMTGIRNPKAHANVEIRHERAVHFLFLASLLMFKLDEAMPDSTPL